MLTAEAADMVPSDIADLRELHEAVASTAARARVDP
jgi:hypothetical protein